MVGVVGGNSVVGSRLVVVAKRYGQSVALDGSMVEVDFVEMMIDPESCAIEYKMGH